MSFWLALLIAAAIVAVLAGVTMFGIAAVSAPRGITTGPAVTTARVLFIVTVMALAVLIIAFVVGMATSWA